MMLKVHFQKACLFLLLSVAFGCQKNQCLLKNNVCHIQTKDLHRYAQDNSIDKLVLHGPESTDFSLIPEHFPKLQVLHFNFTTGLKQLPDLNALSDLKTLRIEGTQIAQLSDEISQLSLKRIHIQHNPYLVSLSDLDAPLEVLVLRDNPSLEEIPKKIGRKSTLKKLDLSNNALQELPEEVTAYPFLKILDIHGNSLQVLPKRMERLQSLIHLDVSDNPIYVLPRELGQLKTLLELKLHHLPNLQAIPEINGMKSLITLSILDCPMLHVLPSDWSGLHDLMFLDIYTTAIQSLPAELVSRAKLEQVYIRMNPLLQELPQEIAQAQNLRFLMVDQNALTQLPDSIANLSALEHFYADENQITHVTEELCGLSTLQELSLSSNQITELCSDIGELKNVRYLNLHSNPMTQLPEGLEQLSDLESLNLWNVPLTKLPDDIYDLPKLRRLAVSEASTYPNPDIFERLEENIGSHVTILRH